MGHKFKNKIVDNQIRTRINFKRLIFYFLGASLTIVVTVLVTIFMMRRQDFNAVKNEIAKYSLLDPARSIVEQENFFSTIEPVRKQMKEIVAKYEKDGDKIGIYFEFLNTGANVSINQDARFWPASLSKMPTIFVVMKRIEDGKWQLSNELVLFEEDKDDRFGELYKKPVGTKFTIEELVKETLINSDNTAHKILVRNLSSEEYTDMFEALGMEQLFNEDYNITAKEYSRVFRALYNASYLNRNNSQQLLLWSSESKFDEFIGSGVGSDVVFSHKIGEEFKEVVFLDSGIVYVPSRPYLITIMVEVEDGGGVERAQEIMKELSKAAYDYVSQQ
ncbi:MAG: serine hydrolase [Candidatus Falkowbacteria bacterium]|nr:MAG: serine hydrolase [Candidatus Falkowbacteria bacterium]